MVECVSVWTISHFHFRILDILHDSLLHFQLMCFVLVTGRSEYFRNVVSRVGDSDDLHEGIQLCFSIDRLEGGVASSPRGSRAEQRCGPSLCRVCLC